MKRYIILFVLFVLLTKCTSETQHRLVLVSILPQKYFVEQIAGSDFEVEVLISPGASHETYDPTPQQMTRVGEAVLWIKNGNLAFEHQWESRFLDINPHLLIADWSEGLNLIKGECKDQNHDNTAHHHGVDPHYYLSPKAASQLAKNTAEALMKLNPAKEGEYRQKLQILLENIREIDSIANENFLKTGGFTFMIFHPALIYLARDYNLTQIAVEKGGNAPTIKGLREFIDIGRKENIRFILVQQQFDKDNAKTIAREIGAEVVEFDPMAYEWKENMLNIIKILSE